MSQVRAQDDLFETTTMTFGQHLEELRRCLFKAIYGLAIGCTLGFLVGHRVMDVIQLPVETALVQYYEQDAKDRVDSPKGKEMLAGAGYTSQNDLEWVHTLVAEKHQSFEIVSEDASPPGSKAATPTEVSADASQRLKKILIFRPIANDSRIHMNALGTQEAFMIWMQASLLVGIILSSPWLFYQIWQFVAAGLYPHERRYVHLFLPMSVLLFLAGAATAFFFAFERVLTFLLSFNRLLSINPELRINDWMSFVLLLPLAFGVSFQLPLVMLFLERIGLFTVQSYLASWRMAVLVIFVLAMLITPSGDPYTMCLMAGPLTALYFGGVLLCHLFPKQRNPVAQ